MKLSSLLQGKTLRSPDDDIAGGIETPAAETPAATLPPLVGDDLNFSEGYQARIGEHAEGATFKNLADVFKSTKEAQRTITGLNQEKADLTKRLEEGVPAPKELPADAAAFKEQLKMPEMPDGVTIGDEVLDKAIAYSLEKGYGPTELADFLAFDIQRASIEAEAAKNDVFARVGEAKKTIGDAVGEQNYERTIGDAQFVSEALALPLDAKDLVNNPNMVIALSKLKTSLSEGTLKGASVGGVQVTSGGKLSQAEDIVSNSDNPLNAAFYDSSHAQHEQAVATHARLISESAP
jgi:hypothetical protein